MNRPIAAEYRGMWFKNITVCILTTYFNLFNWKGLFTCSMHARIVNVNHAISHLSNRGIMRNQNNGPVLLPTNFL